MEFKWRKWLRIVHRDLGYFFFGMTVIYAASGIALNHIKDWNPSYHIYQQETVLTVPDSQAGFNEAAISNILKSFNEEHHYKKHYFPAPDRLKIFVHGGSVDVNITTGAAYYEKLEKRALFFEINFLHYNPKKLWTWFSDIFSVCLILIALSGLFVIKGKKGIRGRGLWLTGTGVIIPLLFLLLYL